MYRFQRSTKCGRRRRTNSAGISHPPPFRRVTKSKKIKDCGSVRDEPPSRTTYITSNGHHRPSPGARHSLGKGSFKTVAVN